jgi:antirestriction protein
MNADEIEEAYSKGYDGLTKVVCKAEPTMKIGDREFPVIHEEWHMADYDGAISSMDLGEHPSIPKLLAMMNHIDHEEELYTAAYKVYHDSYSRNEHSVEEMTEKVEDIAEQLIYVGEQSLTDYFTEYAYEVGDMKNGDRMESYIDWEHYAQDMMYSYQEITIGDNKYLMCHH